ncbi:hypothetical protein B7494_g3608 [Chlorociboria aeruginascens]|nr:hypothetical protein B7494_g3608 [Chlorociboria aeruginascens]
MGKNGRFGKDYGKVVGNDSKNRPGWKGPAFVKKQTPGPKPQPPEDEKHLTPQLMIPIELQQLLLNIFRDTLSDTLTSDSYQALLQEVKAALYERDFQKAFGKDEYLEVYSTRWSPSRSLGYASIFVGLRRYLADLKSRLEDSEISSGSTPISSPHASSDSSLRVVSFGGGAAEIIAFGGLLRYLRDVFSLSTTLEDQAAEDLNARSLSEKTLRIELVLVDTAPWENVSSKLHAALTAPPPLSKYASVAAREANLPLIPTGSLTSTFRCQDVLSMSQDQLAGLIGQRPVLLTLLFTLNELYTTSIGKTTAFLLNLTSVIKPGSLLLVVDSPGSYSETAVGTESKKYPMHWLMNHTLLGTEKSGGEESVPNWEKEISEESQWFRMPEGIKYPISLENMRYQLHLYRKT